MGRYPNHRSAYRARLEHTGRAFQQNGHAPWGPLNVGTYPSFANRSYSHPYIREINWGSVRQGLGPMISATCYEAQCYAITIRSYALVTEITRGEDWKSLCERLAECP